MKVRELKEILNKFDDELEILLLENDDEEGRYIKMKGKGYIEKIDIDMSNRWEDLDITREEYEDMYYTVYEGEYLVITIP